MHWSVESPEPLYPFTLSHMAWYSFFYSIRCIYWQGGTCSRLGIIFFEFFYISIVFVMVEHVIFATKVPWFVE